MVATITDEECYAVRGAIIAEALKDRDAMRSVAANLFREISSQIIEEDTVFRDRVRAEVAKHLEEAVGVVVLEVVKKAVAAVDDKWAAQIAEQVWSRKP